MEASLMLWLFHFLIGSLSGFEVHSIPVAGSQQENCGAAEVGGIRPSNEVAGHGGALGAPACGAARPHRRRSNQPQLTGTSATSAATIDALVRGSTKWMIAVATT